jgi:hypothetical protein
MSCVTKDVRKYLGMGYFSKSGLMVELDIVPNSKNGKRFLAELPAPHWVVDGVNLWSPEQVSQIKIQFAKPCNAFSVRAFLFIRGDYLPPCFKRWNPNINAKRRSVNKAYGY